MATSSPSARRRIADNRLKDTTKSRYGRKVTIFVSWLSRNFPTFVGPEFEEKEFDMNAMTSEIFDDFFEHICQKLQKDGTYFSPTKYQSFEHVSGYNSALKYHYKKHKIPFRDDWSDAISEFLTSPKFAQLPAHFLNKADEPPILSESEWESILPGYTTYYPKVFRPVIPYLLASLVHHRGFLDRTMPSNHPLRLQRVWTSGILSSLFSRVHTGVGKNPITNLAATGIPPPHRRRKSDRRVRSAS